jgi:hypothetical protein
VCGRRIYSEEDYTVMGRLKKFEEGCKVYAANSILW